MNNYGNIEDYILWRGDLPFSEKEFNLIDNLVLSELSYVDYSVLDPELLKEGITLRKAGKEILSSGRYALKNLYGGQQKFFELAVHSTRFGSLVLRNYTETFSSEDDTQFAAVTVDINQNLSVVLFRGTDDSIIGWKEDFMISFTRTGSQKLSAGYLEREVSAHPERHYFVSGHSKGGNLAMYACAYLSEEEQKQIWCIFDNDGPGFAPDVFDCERIRPLYQKTVKIIPEFCLIGKIYEADLPVRHIVASSIKGVNSHDMISWKLDGIHLQEVPSCTVHSDRLIHILMQWAQAASVEERRIFVNEVFDALQAGGAESVNDITRKGFIRVLKAISETSPTSKRIGESLLKYAVGLE